MASTPPRWARCRWKQPEKPGRHPGQLSGRSPYLQAVHCEGPDRLIGQIVPVRIDVANKMSLARRAADGTRVSRPEYIPLSDAAARAVAGPASRHAALIEDAFNVLIETPGGGVSVDGDAKSRAAPNRR